MTTAFVCGFVFGWVVCMFVVIFTDSVPFEESGEYEEEFDYELRMSFL